MTTIRPNEPSIDVTSHQSADSLKKVLMPCFEQIPLNRVQYLVSRNIDGSRNIHHRVHLDIDLGVIEDRWHQDPDRNIHEQIAAMNISTARIFANGQSLTLFGDALFLDIDMRPTALPIGSHLHIHDCILAVTPEPHNPCAKFRQRFGHPAFQACMTHRTHNLRGIYLHVIRGGTIRLHDPITVIKPERAHDEP